MTSLNWTAMVITSLTFVELLLAILILLLSYVYINYRKVYTFWSSRGIPGPTPLPFFGNSLPYLFRCFRDVDDGHFKKYGKTYGIYEGSKPVLITSDATLISKIWITNFSLFSKSIAIESPDPMDMNNIAMVSGEDWKRARTVFSNSFSTSKVKVALENVKPVIDKFFMFLDRRVSACDTFDGKELFSLLTLDIVITAFYSMDIDIYQGRSEFRDNAKNMINFRQLDTFLLEKLPSWLSNKFGIGLMSHESTSYFKKVIVHIAKERMRSVDKDSKRRDMLQLLLDAKDDDAVLKGKGLQEIEVMANSVMLLGAAFDTMTATLTFLSWRMSRNSDAQAKLYEEVIGTMGTDLSKEVTYEDVKSFEFLEAALNEAMRMNNISFRSSRSATQDTVIPGTDIDIPQGTAVHVPLYTLHYDTEYFSEPNVFKPERFLPNALEKIVAGSFMPFGLGPRQCVAIRYALVNMKQVFAELIRRYEIVAVDDGKEDLQLPRGMWMATNVTTRFKLISRTS